MNSRKTLSETRRGYTAGKAYATAHSWQLPQILIVDVKPPFWANTCSKLCEALENFFCLACSLAGPCRIPLLSLYVVQNQHECLLPFVQVKGSFPRLQTCISELRSLPREGSFQQKGDRVMQAVQDGLQQFKQYTRHMLAGGSVNSSVEITVLTSQPGKDMVKQLETGLREIDLVSLRKLQIIEISQGDLLESADVEWHIHAEEEVSSDDSAILGMDIDLQTIENDVVSLETLFKTWLHDHGTDREQLHLLLPSGDFRHFTAPRTSLTCVKCDIQERLLSPALLPGAADVTVRTDDVNTPYQMAASPATTLYKLRVIKALKAEGVCESALFGLPFIIKPTSCWQLDWDELEMNQHNFHALCHSLLKRDWMLLAKREPQSVSPSWSITVNSYYVIIPSDSFTLLVKAIAVRELLLPCNVPALPADLPETALSTIESALNSLEVEPRYNPLDVKSNLYKYLVSEFSRPQYRQQAQPKEHRSGERHHSRQHLSKAKATVAPLPLAPPPPKAFRSSAARKDACELPLFSDEDSEFLGSM
ncbi:meiosis 1 arrest protein [Mauremys mutica]|uniref:meiosis 1 arrest protein n=1 Tax=Mauremys mutica TaxID=74926 RepID=UPI001D16B84C|nr:meiosis 1 arrest protein [Mauremys mutica]XP_044874748.1 meiosis 1 arrest protein [Mauremys mutica]